MANLILVRHGNTFEKGQKATWVGARTDFPLTQGGEAQGEAIAQMIAARFTPLSGLIAGPLQRTKRVAELIANQTQTVFTIDERLTEIDYGLWENKTSEEICTEFGSETLRAWEEEGLWPKDMNWAPKREKIIQNIESFLAEQHKLVLAFPDKNRVAVTSNGILRFVYKRLTGRAAGAEAKVKTGHYCTLSPADNGWVIGEWNQKP